VIRLYQSWGDVVVTSALEMEVPLWWSGAAFDVIPAIMSSVIPFPDGNWEVVEVGVEEERAKPSGGAAKVKMWNAGLVRTRPHRSSVCDMAVNNQCRRQMDGQARRPKIHVRSRIFGDRKADDVDVMVV
jgi:hypothetical protein